MYIVMEKTEWERLRQRFIDIDYIRAKSMDLNSADDKEESPEEKLTCYACSIMYLLFSS